MRRSRHRSFQALLVFVVALQIVAAVVLVCWFTLAASHRAVDAQLAELVGRTSSQVQDHLDSFLEQAQMVNTINVQAVQLGLVNPRDREKLAQQFWSLGEIFKGVGTIGFADSSGSFVGTNRPENYLVFGIPGEPGRLIRHAPGTGKLFGREIDNLEGYDARDRSWYRAAVEARKAVWADFSPSIGRDRFDITAVQPVFAPDGTLLGVFMVDVAIDQLSDFLRQLNLGAGGEAFIIDGRGRLVASSVKEALVTPVAGGGWNRKQARTSASPLVRAIANIQQQPGHEWSDDRSFDLELDGKYSVRMLSLGPFAPDLDWSAVVVIPEAELTGPVRMMLRNALYLSAVILFLAVVVGMFTGRWIAQPLLRLNRAAKVIAEGDLSHRVAIEREDEIGELAASFNQMIERLEASFSDLEARNRELIDQKEKLRRLASEVLLAERRERRRIAADVHDTTVQSLAIARIRLGKLRRELEESPVADLAKDATRLVDEAIAQARALLYELSPPALYELGLGPALEWLAEQFQERFSIECRVHFDSFLPEADEDCRTVLFQSARELLLNVAKHADARTVDISIMVDGTDLILEVRDNGRGFDTAIVQERPSRVGGFGLFSIRERVELLNGHLDIASRRGRGTRISLTVPIAEKQELAS